MSKIVSIVMIFIFSVFMTACSVFQSSKQINMAPFSDNAETLFSEAAKVSRPFQWKYLKPYTKIEEFQAIITMAAPLFEALRGVVYYSNQVVAINNSKLSDKGKNRQLAKYLFDTLEKAVKDQQLDSLQLDESTAIDVLENIRNSKTYLEGIAAAGPIVYSVVSAIQRRLDKIQLAIDPIEIVMDRQIEEDYRATRINYERLIALQEKLMLSVTRIYRARIGDTAELDTLLRENISLKEYIPSATNASPGQLMAAESQLQDQLRHIDEMFKQLDEIKLSYIAKRNELIAWRAQVDEKIMIARTAMTIWAQSHRNLGNGIPVPPLFDVAGFATGLVGTAANTVVP